MSLQTLFTYCLFPVRAVISRKFYFDVLFYRRGIGLTYIILLCAVLAVPSSLKVKSALESLKQFELPTLVGKIPASYVNDQGQLTASNPSDNKPLVLYNSKHVPVIVYNLEGKNIPELNNVQVPITIAQDALLFNTKEGIISVPWTSIYGTEGGVFEPLEAAKVMDSAFSSSYYSVWLFVTIWLFCIMAFVVLISAAACKVLSTVLLKMKLTYALSLRLCSYGSTLVGIILLGQFFFNISISFILMCVIPMLYVLNFIKHMRAIIFTAINDPYSALSINNPMFPVFDKASRTRADGSYDDSDVDFMELDESQKKERIECLMRHLGTITQFAHGPMASGESANSHSNYTHTYRDQGYNDSDNFTQESQRPYSGSDDVKGDNVQKGSKGDDSSFTP